MSNFQQPVRIQQTTLFPGNIFADGPVRAKTLTLNSGDPTLNVVGSAFTYLSGNDTQVEAGGTGVFAGILFNPKEYASFGSVSPTNPLGPTLTLNNGIGGDFATMVILAVDYGVNTDNVIGAAAIGDQIVFEQSTGLLSAIAPAAVAPAGFTIITNAQVTYFNITAAGFGVATLLGGQP